MPKHISLGFGMKCNQLMTSHWSFVNFWMQTICMGYHRYHNFYYGNNNYKRCVFFFLFCRQTLYKKKLRLQTKIIIWPCTFQRVLWYPIHIVCIQKLTKLQWLVISWLHFIPKPKLICLGMQIQFLYLVLIFFCIKFGAKIKKKTHTFYNCCFHSKNYDMTWTS
jgi:hypothetical protein